MKNLKKMMNLIGRTFIKLNGEVYCEDYNGQQHTHVDDIYAREIFYRYY